MSPTSSSTSQTKPSKSEPEDAVGSDAVGKAEVYYDSSEADEFYFHIWGGEDIHVGLYFEDSDTIADASHRTVERMLKQLEGLGPDTKVLDLGAGYGGAARVLAKRYGCHVTCLNLSEAQNARNRELNIAQGLSERIRVVHGNFESIPEPSEQFDVVWSQDSLLHSGARAKVIEEAYRVLRPGGHLLFTDPMQSDDCPEGVLQSVLERIHLASLGSFKFYRATAETLGLEEVACEELTVHLVRHYARVRKELSGRYDEMIKRCSQAYVDRMMRGLEHWVAAGEKGYLSWGILHFRRK